MNEEFIPEYPGDNPNRKWVRDAVERHNLTREVAVLAVKALPPEAIRIMFNSIMARPFPAGLGNEYPV